MIINIGHLLRAPLSSAVPQSTPGRDRAETDEIFTLPGTNMEVENGPLEDHFPLQTGGFPLPC